MSEKTLTSVQIKALPWPGTLFEPGALTARDAFEVGKIIVQRVWQGQFDRGHQRKQWSVRQLHAALGVGSPARFTRCVQVYEVASELKLGSLKGLPVSTLFLVAGLPQAQRKKVALQALKENWSKHKLEQHIQTLIGPRTLGRPQGPVFLRALRQCAQESLLTEVDKLNSVDAATLRMAVKQTDRLLKDLERVRKALRQTK
ncbi:MAG TPA: hypothetical protein VL137_00520 [Polyangiaceae bacterium]|nr:hypothetical protein [Polyangiaceae bacterium]